MKNYELDAPNTNPEIGVFKIPDNSVMGHAAIEAAKTVANSENENEQAATEGPEEINEQEEEPNVAE